MQSPKLLLRLRECLNPKILRRIFTLQSLYVFTSYHNLPTMKRYYTNHTKKLKNIIFFTQTPQKNIEKKNREKKILT